MDKIILREGDVYKTPSGNKEVCSTTLNGHYIGDYIFKEGYSLVKRKEDIKTFFSVGDVIQGFCNGYFGRDDYNIKTCVAVFDKFAVFIYEDGHGEVLNYPSDNNLFWSCVETWRV